MPRNGSSRVVAASLLSFILYVLPPFVRGKPIVIANLLDLAGLDPWGEFRRDILIDVPGGFEALLPIAAIVIVLFCQVGYLLSIKHVLRWNRLLARAFAVLFTGFGFLVLVGLGEELALRAGFRAVEPLLISRNRPAPQKTTWPVDCDDPRYEIEPFVDTPPNGILGRSGQTWVRNRKTKRIGLLRVSNCTVLETAFREGDFLISRFYATANGRAIFVKSNDRSDPEQWWFLNGIDAQPAPIPRPNMSDDAWPVLSDDGNWVAWVVPTKLPSHDVVLQSTQTGEKRTVSSGAFSSDRVRLLGVDTGLGELLITRRNYEEALAVSMVTGDQVWGPVEFGQNDWNQSVVGRILRSRNGWIAWYGNPRSNTIQWSLQSVKRTYHLPAGTQINSIDMSPDGSLIAVGTDGDFVGSSIESAVYVLSASTAEELFRKYFPRRSWVKVAFLGTNQLAYSASSQGLLVSGSELRVIHVTSQH